MPQVALAGFFLLPFCLVTGRMAQGGGLYLFALILPLVAWRSPPPSDGTLREQTWHRGFGQLGLCMLLAYFLFPLMDAANFVLGSHPEIEFRSRYLYRSAFSTAVGITGLLWLIIGMRRCRILDEDTRLRIYKNFTYGIGAASLLLFIYGCVQWLTGYHFAEVARYRPDRVMLGSFYRVSGFSTHPVPFAGYALGVAVLYATMAMQVWKKTARFEYERWLYVFVAVAHALLLIMSGGRGGLLGFVVTMPIAAMVVLPFGWRQKAALTAAMLLAIIPIGFMTGMFERIGEAIDAGGQAILGDRRFFWRVHWEIFRDHPVIGAGWSSLRAGVRDAYYQSLELGGLRDQYNAHNIYLEVLSASGAVGALGLIALAGRFSKLLFERCTHAGLRPMAVAFGFAFLANLIHGLTQNTFFDTPVIMVYLYWLWLIYWLGKRDS